jgi:hypothetical protein
MSEEKRFIDVMSNGSAEVQHSEGVPELAKELGTDIAMSCRLSNVEWENHVNHTGTRVCMGTCPKKNGWVVRSAHDQELAVRVHTNPSIVDLEDRRTIQYLEDCMGKAERSLWTILGHNINQPLAVFDSRDEAIREELLHFTAILEDRRKYEAYKQYGQNSEDSA